MLYTAKTYKESHPESVIQDNGDGSFYVDEPDREGPYYFYGPIEKTENGKEYQVVTKNVKKYLGYGKHSHEEVYSERVLGE